MGQLSMTWVWHAYSLHDLYLCASFQEANMKALTEKSNGLPHFIMPDGVASKKCNPQVVVDDTNFILVMTKHCCDNVFWFFTMQLSPTWAITVEQELSPRSFTLRAPDALPALDPKVDGEIERATIGVLSGAQNWKQKHCVYEIYAVSITQVGSGCWKLLRQQVHQEAHCWTEYGTRWVSKGFVRLGFWELLTSFNQSVG